MGLDPCGTSVLIFLKFNVVFPNGTHCFLLDRYVLNNCKAVGEEFVTYNIIAYLIENYLLEIFDTAGSNDIGL